MSAQSTDNPLEGCPAPSALARGLVELQKRGWRNVTFGWFDEIEKLWGVGLSEGGKCEPSCIYLVNEGRVINNNIECGESLHILTSRPDEATLKLQLKSVTIRYTTRTEVSRDAVEKALVGGIRLGDGLKEDSGVTTHMGPFRYLTWTDVEPEHRACNLRVYHSKTNNRWQVVLALSCDPDER